MQQDGDDRTFALTVHDVFTLTGRGTVVVGPIESGVLRSGEPVGVVRSGSVVARAEAFVELICSRSTDPRTIALVLRGLDGARPEPGDVVERS